jgi:hypothetical protein
MCGAPHHAARTIHFDLESCVVRSVFVSASFACIVGAIVVSGCGPTRESQRKAAQSGAEKYFELVKAGQYAEAYQRTFTKGHQRQMSQESFETYRRAFAAQTGAIRAVTLVKANERPGAMGFHMVYALEGANAQQPAYEILDVELEGDDWKIASVDRRLPGSAVP